MKNILIKSKSSKMSCLFSFLFFLSFFFFFFFFFPAAIAPKIKYSSFGLQMGYICLAIQLSLSLGLSFHFSPFVFLDFTLAHFSFPHILFLPLFFLSSCMWPPLLFVFKKSSYYNFYKNKIISCINKSIKIKISN
jgi:hypothetical protein